MTCIVGIKHGGRVWIGGDSAGVAGYQIIGRRDEKVFAVGPYIFGFTSSFRMGQLLRYKFKAPEPPKKKNDLARFMVSDFIDSVRQTFKDGGFMRKESEQESGGFFLVGVKDRLFQIDPDYQVGIPILPYAAIGAGMEYAYGSLFSSDGHKPEHRIHLALLASEKFCTGVRAPFKVVKTMAAPRRDRGND